MTRLPGAPVDSELDPPAGDAAPASAGRNAAVMTAATVVAQAATFALSIAMGRLLGPETYGVYGLAAAIATVVVPIADLGLTQYLAREVARLGPDARGVVRRCLVAKATSSLAILGVAAIVVPLAFDDGRITAAILLLFGARLADGAAHFVFGYFQGREQMGLQARLTTATSLARGVGGIGIVIAFEELTPVLIWIALTSVLQLLRAGVRMRAILAHERATAADIPIAWGSVVAMGLVTVFAMLYLRADTIMIAALEDERQVGWYTAAYALMAALQIVPWMISLALSPVFARTHARDPGEFRRAWNDGLRAVMLISAPLALLVSLLAADVMERFYGAGFAAASSALAILVWSSLFWGGNMLLSAALRGAHRERWVTIATGAGAFANIVLNLWAIPRWGIEGAAATTVATEALVLLALAGLAIPRRTVPRPRLPVAGWLVALVGLAATALLLRDGGLELAAIAALAAYVGLLALTRTLAAEDVRTLRGAIRR